MEITGRQESAWGSYIDIGTVVLEGAVSSYYNPEDNLHLRSGDGNQTAFKVGGGVISGPLRLGVSLQPVIVNPSLFATEQVYFVTEDAKFYFGRVHVALEAYFDALNKSRFTPYVGIERGRQSVFVPYPHNDAPPYLFSESISYLRFGSGVSIGLGRHPTSLNRIRTELDIGIRYERGDDNIVDGTQKFYLGDSNTAVSVLLRWSPRPRRWW